MKYYIILVLLLFLAGCTDNRTEIILRAEAVHGLTSEAELQVNGFKIGEVEDFAIATDGTIDIRCKINPDIAIPSDSKFSIDKTKLIGSTGIDIKLGESLNLLENGDIIKLTTVENTPLGDKVVDFIEQLTNTQKQDSLLIELRRLNENLENRK